jgi:hypothetical protein
VALWRRLWVEGERAAGLALAMHLEHHLRDVAGAESLTRALLQRAADAERDALEHRLARLLRKRSRSLTVL